MTMNARICHNLGQLDILSHRKSHAKETFQKSYGAVFREQTKLDHCLKRLDSASKTYADSIFGCVPGLKVKSSPQLGFGVELDCVSFRQPFNGQWGVGSSNSG